MTTQVRDGKTTRFAAGRVRSVHGNRIDRDGIAVVPSATIDHDPQRRRPRRTKRGRDATPYERRPLWIRDPQQPWTRSYGSSQLLVKTGKARLEAVAVLIEVNE
jgi:hypothetical protein